MFAWAAFSGSTYLKVCLFGVVASTVIGVVLGAGVGLPLWLPAAKAKETQTPPSAQSSEPPSNVQVGDSNCEYVPLAYLHLDNRDEAALASSGDVLLPVLRPPGLHS